MAAEFCLGSLLQASPQVYLAQSIPVNKPNTPKNKPTLADSTAMLSWCSLPDDKYLML